MRTFDVATFIKRFQIDEQRFTARSLSWDTHQQIYAAFREYQKELIPAMESMRSLVHGFPGVHSVRARIKDDLHLVEKCIRKQLEDPSRTITAENYKEQITDLIGIRALHLFKNDWAAIHSEITKTWDLVEPPIAYYREGDPQSLVDEYAAAGCTPKKHSRHYRSVHYVAKSSLTRRQVSVEIQVRTIFEEGWSEVDHRIKYPYGCSDIVGELLSVLNRLSGSADEMATHLNQLNELMADTERDVATQLAQKDEALASLNETVNRLQLEHKEKSRMLENLQTLRGSDPPNTPGSAGSPFANLLFEIVGGSRASRATKARDTFIQNAMAHHLYVESPRNLFAVLRTLLFVRDYSVKSAQAPDSLETEWKAHRNGLGSTRYLFRIVQPSPGRSSVQAIAFTRTQAGVTAEARDWRIEWDLLKQVDITSAQAIEKGAHAAGEAAREDPG